MPQFLLLLLGLAACNSEVERTSTMKPLTQEQAQVKIEQVKLNFTGPLSIDSSVYVMYPLLLNTSEGETEIYKSRSPTNTYWNIAFYNTATGESHLLTTAKKMVIENFNSSETTGDISVYSAADFAKYEKDGHNQASKLLYYSIKSNDYNHDGALNDKDPTYLYTSDKAGNNFKQISPDNYSVDAWQLLKGTNKVLMQARRDTDNNQEFNGNDSTTPLVCTIQPEGPAREVFSKGFNSEVKKLLNNQWATKP